MSALDEEEDTFFLISHIEIAVLRSTIHDLKTQLAAAKAEDNAGEVALLLERNVDLAARNTALQGRLDAMRVAAMEWLWEEGGD